MAELIARMDKLTPETTALWGKMHAAQMLSHVHEPLMILKGEKQLKFTLLGMLFGKYLKKKYLRDRGFGKNLPTHEQFKISDSRQFADEKAKLTKTLQEILNQGPSIVTKEKHPFFGVMTPEEWDDMMYLHLNHHFTQFGI